MRETRGANQRRLHRHRGCSNRNTGLHSAKPISVGRSMAEARLLEAKEKLADNQKSADEKFAAEIAAVIEYYERTGQAPEGYVITG